VARSTNSGPGRRLAWSAVLALALVATAVAIPSYGSRGGNLLARYDATKAAVLEALPHTDPPGTPAHNHNDPATKNLVSRAGETGTDVQDPTTADEKRANAAYVAAERQTADPRLTTVRVRAARHRHPQNRYAMANGCYSLTRRGEPLFFKPTDLGTYLLYDAHRRFVSAAGGKAAAPSTDTEWTARAHGHRLGFTAAARPSSGAAGLRSGSPVGTAARPTPSPRSTSRAGRTPVSRRTRRSAGTSTRTPTAWPSSSWAARTAASRGTGTARRTRSWTAPTTRPGSTRSSRSSPATRPTTRWAGLPSRTGRLPSR
jgi:hypothetical protein